MSHPAGWRQVSGIVALCVLAGCTARAPPVENPDTAGDPFSTTHFFPGDYEESQPRLLSQGPFKGLMWENATLQSQLDGVDIGITIVRPVVEGGRRVPVIVDAGPYYAPKILGVPNEVRDFVSHGFAWAMLPVRGTGASGGCMDFHGPAETHDIDQAITWLGEQSWSNGNVGMYGGSYDGGTGWQAASTGNPHLKTIVPGSAAADQLGLFLRNGTYWGGTHLVSYNYWLNVANNPLWVDANTVPPTFGLEDPRQGIHYAEVANCPEMWTTGPASLGSYATDSPEFMEYWSARDYEAAILEKYRGTVFLPHGLADTTVEPHGAYPFVSQLEERGIIVKHLVGRWGHSAPPRTDFSELLFHWFQRWLYEDPSVDIGTRAQVLDTMGQWRSADTWPPLGSRKAFFLEGGGHLDDSASSRFSLNVGSPVPLVDPERAIADFNAPLRIYDESTATMCEACPEFRTDTIDEDLRFAGAAYLDLTLTPTGPGHVTALLFSESSDGALTRLTYAMADLGHAIGGTQADAAPGAMADARLEFEHTDAVVPAGSRLMVRLTQGGVAERWPPAPPMPFTLHAGRLELSTFTASAEDFFDAPDWS